MLSSIAERCPIKEVDWGSQQDWNQKVAESIASIVDVNPYLSVLEPGTEVLAVDATSLGALSGLDCRPKIYDSISKTWKLCDTGSMLTVVKKVRRIKSIKARFYKQSMGQPSSVMVIKIFKSGLIGRRMILERSLLMSSKILSDGTSLRSIN